MRLLYLGVTNSCLIDLRPAHRREFMPGTINLANPMAGEVMEPRGKLITAALPNQYNP